MALAPSNNDLILVRCEIGLRPSLDYVQGNLSWFGYVIKEADALLTGRGTSGHRLQQSPIQDYEYIWVERMRFNNPLEIILGGSACWLVYKIVTVIRDWSSERSRRQAETRSIEAGARVREAEAQELELRNRMWNSILAEAEARGFSPEILERSLERMLGGHHIASFTNPPSSVDAEVVAQEISPPDPD